MAQKTQSLDEFNAELENAADLLLKTRPTAVSLANAIRMVMKYRAEDVDSARQAVQFLTPITSSRTPKKL